MDGWVGVYCIYFQVLFNGMCKFSCFWSWKWHRKTSSLVLLENSMGIPAGFQCSTHTTPMAGYIYPGKWHEAYSPYLTVSFPSCCNKSEKCDCTSCVWWYSNQNSPQGSSRFHVSLAMLIIYRLYTPYDHPPCLGFFLDFCIPKQRDLQSYWNHFHRHSLVRSLLLDLQRWS